MAHLLFYGTLASLSFASSPQVSKTLPYLPLTTMPEREVQGVQEGERDIVGKIQISKWGLTKWNRSCTWSDRPFQQPIHACCKWVWSKHTTLSKPRLNVKPWALDISCPNGMIIEALNSDYLVRDTKPCQHSAVAIEYRSAQKKVAPRSTYAAQVGWPKPVSTVQFCTG